MTTASSSTSSRNFVETWNLIQQDIQRITNMVEQKTSIELDLFWNLYTKIYILVIKDQGPRKELYDGYTKVFNEYINLKVLPALKQQHGVELLKELVKRWENHKLMVKCLSKLFKYLDRFYVRMESVPTVEDVGLEIFFNLVYGKIKINARNTVIELIEKEREEEEIDRSLLKNVLGIFVEIRKGEMDCYLNDFEEPMLEASRNYYSRKAALWIIEKSCPEYLLKVEQCLEREKKRVSHYLHASTEKNLLDEVQNVLLAPHENQILGMDSGLRFLLRENKKDDLSRMFRLFNEIDGGLDPIANIFQEFVTAEGTELIKQAEDAMSNNEQRRGASGTPEQEQRRGTSGTPEQEFIRKVIEMHQKYEHYVLDYFQKHKLFQKALEKAFETTCNKGIAGSKTADLLSVFCDNVLRQGSSGNISDDEMELKLENVVKILRYVEEKDLFEEFYRQKLGRRLLFDKSANDSNERSMLAKLKHQNGTQFTFKMEGMVNDFSLVRINQNKFEAYLHREDKHVGIDLSVKVLTSGYWPAYKSPYINLPIELARCIDTYKQFYSRETRQRKLTWIYSLGTCTVEGSFDAKTIDMLLSTYQAALLMLFNESEKLSFDDIKSQLNLEDDDVNKVLASLALGRHRVLLKEPDSQEIEPTDYFEFNSKFNPKNITRIKFLPRHSEEKKKIIDVVVKDRKYEIDAAIVRIMKSRKVLSVQELQSECLQLLKPRFKLDGREMKKRMEDLISRSYLEREGDGGKVIKYMA